MDRRRFVGGVLACGVLTCAAGGVWFSIDGNQYPLTIAAAREQLKKLKHMTQAKAGLAAGDWSLAQMLIHCAQSVEYSMQGFPEHKPQWFKHSAGALAFKAFAAKGRMTHPLTEAIPGAPLIASNASVEQAFERLEAALVLFSQFNGLLAPHFAYGYLSKPQYEQAHVMHFYNHLTVINPPH